MKIIKLILKVILLLILIIALPLLLIYINASILGYLYGKSFDGSGVFIIISDNFKYLLNFMILFVISLFGFLKKDVEKQSLKLRYPKGFKLFILGGVLITLFLYFINIKSLNILYEDRFIVHRLFNNSQEYKLEDIESFEVKMPGSKRKKDLVMVLNTKDGRKIDLFGSIEYPSDEFGDKYDSYEYQLDLNNRLLEKGIKKYVADREKILKETDYYDEPYKGYIRSLVEGNRN